MVRCFILGLNPRINLRAFGIKYGDGTDWDDDSLNARSLRGGRRYFVLGLAHRQVFQLGPANPNLVLFQVGAAP